MEGYPPVRLSYLFGKIIMPVSSISSGDSFPKLCENILVPGLPAVKTDVIIHLALFHNEWVIRKKAHDLLPFDVELSMTTTCEPAHRFDFQFCLACKLCRYLLIHSHSTKLHRVFPIQNCELKQRLHTSEWKVKRRKLEGWKNVGGLG